MGTMKNDGKGTEFIAPPVRLKKRGASSPLGAKGKRKDLVTPLFIFLVLVLVAVGVYYLGMGWRTKIEPSDLTITYLEGTPSICKKEQGLWRALHARDRLRAGDSLYTGASPLVVLQVGEDSSLRVDRKSRLTFLDVNRIGDFRNIYVRLRLDTGRIFMEKNAPLRIQADAAQGAAIMADRYSEILVSKNAGLCFICWKGKGQFIRARGGKGTIDLKEGEILRIDPELGIPILDKLDRGKIDRWQAWNLKYSFENIINDGTKFSKLPTAAKIPRTVVRTRPAPPPRSVAVRKSSPWDLSMGGDYPRGTAPESPQNGGPGTFVVEGRPQTAPRYSRMYPPSPPRWDESGDFPSRRSRAAAMQRQPSTGTTGQGSQGRSGSTGGYHPLGRGVSTPPQENRAASGHGAPPQSASALPPPPDDFALPHPRPSRTPSRPGPGTAPPPGGGAQRPAPPPPEEEPERPGGGGRSGTSRTGMHVDLTTYTPPAWLTKKGADKVPQETVNPYEINANIVHSDAEAEAIFKDVERSLRSYFGMTFKNRIIGKMVKSSNFDSLTVRTSGLGSVTTVAKLDEGDRGEHIVYVLEGIDKNFFFEIAASEYTQAWLIENTSGGRSRTEYGGFMVWIAYKLAIKKGVKAYARAIYEGSESGWSYYISSGNAAFRRLLEVEELRGERGVFLYILGGRSRGA
jgi:hypothetical protein